MKTSFQKTLIAASIGVAMFAAVSTASANSLLFPYFTTNSGAQSVLSLSNTATGTGTGVVPVHYVYNYGTACTHYDANGSLTANDILSHSIASPAAGGFGLAVGTDKSIPVYFPLANQSGFLVVSSKNTTSTTALRGSMAIVDPSSGLVVSYPGIDNALDTSATEGNFSAIKDLNFPLTSLPGAVVATSWYAVVVGDMSTAITNGANWTGAVSFSNNGNVYNNDEVAYSGTATKTITCSGALVPTDLATSAQASAVGSNGGLINSVGTVVAGTPATGVVLMKLQYVQPAVGGVFGGKQFLHREGGTPTPAPVLLANMG
ncbi:hypothetical protein [Polaromonas sp.]|uniref:hypothetical protein n=1 Tax=Polaromonas sp. TaxID=1869339 RepID=UPI0017AF5ACF|nr:hypothetical protein [Polaromonas sp.]NML84114.1 hypothetical protein [Polaromonas sp.]